MKIGVRRGLFLSGFFPVLGCITININFPAKQVERAAEVIVGEARPEENPNGNPDPGGAPPQNGTGTLPKPPEGGPEAPPPPPGRPDSGAESAPPGEKKDGSSSARAARERGAGRFVLATFSPGAAGGQDSKKAEGGSDIQIDINTPIIKEIRQSLRQRFAKLLPFYEKGAIGENREGYLEIRDETKLSLTEKRNLKALIDGENRDRKNLYQEIVRANKFDDSRLKDVQRIFAEEWIDRSRTGWWIQTKKGEWVKKPPPEKKSEGKKA
jgi:uncharacterized protein YdbL (DUF1318 family)